MKNKKEDNKVGRENGSVSMSRPRKRTGDGLAIYMEEEFGIGKAYAGGTPLYRLTGYCVFFFLVLILRAK